MVIILTTVIVVLGVGLSLLFIGIRGARPAVSADTTGAPEVSAGPSSLDYSAIPRRRVRPIPLVLGALLTLLGAVAVVWVLRQGLDSDRLDELVLRWEPASRLATALDDDSFARRYDAARELERRYAAGELPESVERRLINRHVALLLEDEADPNAPKTGAPIVEIDFLEARKSGKLEAKAWGTVVARTAPFRLDVPRRVAPGEPLTTRMILSLRDHQSPAWVIAVVEDLTIDGKPVPAPPAIAIAPNPDWKEPPPPEVPVTVTPGEPPTRRVVRYEHVIPVDVMASLGTGVKEVKGRSRIYAFDPTVLPPPEGLTDANTFMPRRNVAPEDELPEALSLKLTPEQAKEYIAKALGTIDYPLERRVEIGVATTQPTTRRGGGGGGGDGGGGGGGGGGGN